MSNNGGGGAVGGGCVCVCVCVCANPPNLITATRVVNLAEPNTLVLCIKGIV